MITYPNQRVVSVNKNAEKNLYHPYANISQEAMSKAMILLKDSTFKIWCYLSKNQNGFELALSPVDVRRFTGVSQASYKRAINELIEKGYLVKRDKNYYDFYEEIEEKKMNITIHKKEIDNYTF